jgi:hypothetical protein
MDQEELKTRERIATEPDYIAMGRYSFSLKKLEARYQDGCPDHVIALAFGLTLEELEDEYQRIVACIQSKMGVDSGHAK